MLVACMALEWNVLIIKGLNPFSILKDDVNGLWEGTQYIHIGIDPCIVCVSTITSNFLNFDKSAKGISYTHEGFFLPKFLRK
jgi:hypothetical protein